MKILLTGSGGQLAQALLPCLHSQGYEVHGVDHAQCDITVPDLIETVFSAVKPAAVINCAAYNQVDRAEAEPAAAFAVNACGPLYLARACKAHGATLLHISTNYVFDGASNQPYRETDCPRPLSVYAASKLSGENLAQSHWERCYIVRTTGLYGLAGRTTRQGNFVETMLRLAAAGNDIRVVNDQWLTPTAAADLAPALVRLLASNRFGIYHLTNSGSTTWFDFARAIFDQAGLSPRLLPVSSQEYRVAARRPAYSVLANAAWNALGFPALPPWQNALPHYFAARN